MKARGKLFLTLLVVAVLAFGAWRWKDTLFGTGSGSSSGTASTSSDPAAPRADPVPAQPGEASPPGLTETMREVPRIDLPGTYVPKGGILEVELSEYAGYAGLIAANGGLEPNPRSVFAEKHGFQVKLSISEEESWSALNSGKLAASATTADVLAVMAAARRRVYDRFGVELEPEVQVLGDAEWPEDWEL